MSSRTSHSLYRSRRIGCVHSWNGDGTDGGDGGRAGYRRTAHLRAAPLQSTIRSGRALSVGHVRAAPSQALAAVAATAAATDQEEKTAADDDDDDAQQQQQQQQQ